VTVTSERHRVRAVNPSTQAQSQLGESGFWSTGAWREGSPQGVRLSVDVGRLRLEMGGALPQVTIAYETWGTLNPAGDNAIMVEHALTGDSHVSGRAGSGHPTPGWWEGLIGPGSLWQAMSSAVVRAPPVHLRRPLTGVRGGVGSRS
jgi:homoserine O-acetyltransferase